MLDLNERLQATNFDSQFKRIKKNMFQPVGIFLVVEQLFHWCNSIDDRNVCNKLVLGRCAFAVPGKCLSLSVSLSLFFSLSAVLQMRGRQLCWARVEVPHQNGSGDAEQTADRVDSARSAYTRLLLPTTPM